MMPPTGWYADPTGRFAQRYFADGRWTEHVSTQGWVGVSPLGAPPAPAHSPAVPLEATLPPQLTYPGFAGTPTALELLRQEGPSLPQSGNERASRAPALWASGAAALILVVGGGLLLGSGALTPPPERGVSEGSPWEEPKSQDTPQDKAALQAQLERVQKVFPTVTFETVEALAPDTFFAALETSSLSPSERAEAVLALASLQAAGYPPETLTGAYEVLREQVATNALLENTDKTYLAAQLYGSRVLELRLPSDSTEQNVAFDYLQIARDLYRDGEARDGAFIQESLRQVKEGLGL